MAGHPGVVLVRHEMSRSLPRHESASSEVICNMLCVYLPWQTCTTGYDNCRSAIAVSSCCLSEHVKQAHAYFHYPPRPQCLISHPVPFPSAIIQVFAHQLRTSLKLAWLLRRAQAPLFGDTFVTTESGSERLVLQERGVEWFSSLSAVAAARDPVHAFVATPRI